MVLLLLVERGPVEQAAPWVGTRCWRGWPSHPLWL